MSHTNGGWLPNCLLFSSKIISMLITGEEERKKALEAIEVIRPKIEKLQAQLDEKDWKLGRKSDAWLILLISYNEMKAKLNMIQWALGEKPEEIKKYNFR